MSSFLKNLPVYQCHKQVHALKIAQLVQNPRGVELHFEDQGYVPMQMPHAWIEKHNVERGGYWVQYEDGYQSYSPAAAFEAGYTIVNGAISFGGAIQALRDGCRVARQGWNGKGMWLQLIPKSHWETTRGLELLDGLPWIGMKTADDKFVPWLASQTDMLANDWWVVVQ